MTILSNPARARRVALWTALSVLLGLGILFGSSQAAYAHYCDDQYSMEMNRAGCWWRYWNSQPIVQEQEFATTATETAACGQWHRVNANELYLAQITDWYGLNLEAVAALNGRAPLAPLTPGHDVCLASVGESPVEAMGMVDASDHMYPAVKRLSNLRAGPGTEFARVGQLASGTPVQPVAHNGDGTWLQLASGNWIWAPLVNHIPSGLPGADAMTPMQPAEKDMMESDMMESDM